MLLRVDSYNALEPHTRAVVPPSQSNVGMKSHLRQDVVILISSFLFLVYLYIKIVYPLPSAPDIPYSVNTSSENPPETPPTFCYYSAIGHLSAHTQAFQHLNHGPCQRDKNSIRTKHVSSRRPHLLWTRC